VKPTHDNVKGLLERHPEIPLAILFGSRAKGEGTVTSDLDIAVASAATFSTV